MEDKSYILLPPRRHHVLHAGHHSASAGDEHPGVWSVELRHLWLLSGRTWVWVCTSVHESWGWRIDFVEIWTVIIRQFWYKPKRNKKIKNKSIKIKYLIRTFVTGPLLCSAFRLLCLLVLPLFHLYDLQEARPVPLSPPAGHRLYSSHHLGHAGLHSGALRHQSRATNVCCCLSHWN